MTTLVQQFVMYAVVLQMGTRRALLIKNIVLHQKYLVTTAHARRKQHLLKVQRLKRLRRQLQVRSHLVKLQRHRQLQQIRQRQLLLADQRDETRFASFTRYRDSRQISAQVRLSGSLLA